MRDVHLPAPPRLDHLRFARSRSDRLVTGVAGGLAHRLEADPLVVRLAFVLLGLAGGIGVVAYAVAWVLSEPEQDDDAAPARPERSLAVGCLTAAALLALRSLGLWPGDTIMVPAAIVATGSALVWHGQRAAGGTRVGADPFERLMTGRLSVPRVAGGLVLTAAGLVGLASEGDLRSVPRSAAALGLALAGVALVLGSYAGRLVSDLRSAERERIRTEERAEMAAQLHDSVLQTLALMQRAAGEPRRMVLLARRQERELRQWLYGQHRQGSGAAATVAEQAEALAADVELDHGVAVELVMVGDHAGDEATAALLGAVREATVNAAKHSGADDVSVYLEIGPGAALAFVRDKGRGFDDASLRDDGRGIANSIRARLERAGGRSRLESAPGVGTEWEMEVPL